MWEQQNRTAVFKRFAKQLETEPYLLDVNGENEWVDNYIKFGDLIEQNMGIDACEFYYEQLYELLLTIENSSKIEVKEGKKRGRKSWKELRGNNKRLF